LTHAGQPSDVIADIADQIDIHQRPGLHSFIWSLGGENHAFAGMDLYSTEGMM
jgi:5-keto 4-deoxyuronate isomerase